MLCQQIKCLNCKKICLKFDPATFVSLKLPILKRTKKSQNILNLLDLFKFYTQENISLKEE